MQDVPKLVDILPWSLKEFVLGVYTLEGDIACLQRLLEDFAVKRPTALPNLQMIKVDFFWGDEQGWELSAIHEYAEDHLKSRSCATLMQKVRDLGDEAGIELWAARER